MVPVRFMVPVPTVREADPFAAKIKLPVPTKGPLIVRLEEPVDKLRSWLLSVTEPLIVALAALEMLTTLVFPDATEIGFEIVKLVSTRSVTLALPDVSPNVTTLVLAPKEVPCDPDTVPDLTIKPPVKIALDPVR